MNTDASSLDLMSVRYDVSIICRKIHDDAIFYLEREMGGLKALRAGGGGLPSGARLLVGSSVNAPGSWGNPSC
jgi:hypothetical protein